MILPPQYITGEDPELINDILDFKINMATDERVIKGLNMIDRFGTDEYLPRKLISMTYSDTQALFTDGEAAMYAMYSWAAGSLANEDDIGIMTWPSTSSDIDMSKVATIWGAVTIQGIWSVVL